MDEFINKWYFSWSSVIIHTVWFVVWFWLDVDINLLTNIVSLEAIFLCLFIGISQKGHSDKLHAKIDAQIDEVRSDG